MRDVAEVFRASGAWAYVAVGLTVLSLGVAAVLAILLAKGKRVPGPVWLLMPFATVLAGVLGAVVGRIEGSEAIAMATLGTRDTLSLFVLHISGLPLALASAGAAVTLGVSALLAGLATAVGAGGNPRSTALHGGLGLGLGFLGVVVGFGLMIWQREYSLLALAASLAATIGVGIAGFRAGTGEAAARSAGGRGLAWACGTLGILAAVNASSGLKLFTVSQALQQATPDTRMQLITLGFERNLGIWIAGLALAAAMAVLLASPALAVARVLANVRTAISVVVGGVLVVVAVVAAAFPWGGAALVETAGEGARVPTLAGTDAAALPTASSGFGAKAGCYVTLKGDDWVVRKGFEGDEYERCDPASGPLSKPFSADSRPVVAVPATTRLRKLSRAAFFQKRGKLRILSRAAWALDRPSHARNDFMLGQQYSGARLGWRSDPIGAEEQPDTGLRLPLAGTLVDWKGKTYFVDPQGATTRLKVAKDPWDNPLGDLLPSRYGDEDVGRLDLVAGKNMTVQDAAKWCARLGYAYLCELSPESSTAYARRTGFAP